MESVTMVTFTDFISREAPTETLESPGILRDQWADRGGYNRQGSEAYGDYKKFNALRW